MRSLFNVQGKVVLVTGGSRAIVGARRLADLSAEPQLAR